MGYTRNFGVRDFTNIVRNGRFKTPADATAANTAGFTGEGAVNNVPLIGTAVQLDSDNPGYLKRPSANQEPDASCGVIVYEHIQWKGTDPALTTPQDFETAPLNSYVQVVRGPGVKVWLKNTTDKPLYDGRSQTGRTLVAGVSIATPTVAVGDYLTVAADGTYQEGTAANGWFLVEDVEGDRVECRFLF